MSQTFDIPRTPVSTPMRTAIEDTVDVFDAAAHLESMGFGASLARQSGFNSTFEHAESLVAKRAAGPAPSWTRPRRVSRVGRVCAALGGAVCRAITLLAVVVLSVLTIPVGTSGRDVFFAGAAGWASGQMVGASMWQGLSWSGRDRAKLNGTWVGLAVLTVTGALAWAMHNPLMLLWAAWCITIAVLSVLVPSRRITTTVAPLALIGLLLAPVSKTASQFGATAVIVLATVATITWLARHARLHHRSVPRLLRGSFNSSVAWISVQTMTLIAQLGTLFAVVGDRFALALSVTGVIGAAVCELIQESSLAATKRSAVSMSTYRQLRRRTGMMGVIAVLATCAVALVAAVGLMVTGAAPNEHTDAFLAGVLLTCLTTTAVGLQLRTGEAAGSALLALGCFATLLACITLWPPLIGAQIAVIPVAIVCALVAYQRTSAVTNW